jgi:hypothetical protein
MQTAPQPSRRTVIVSLVFAPAITTATLAKKMLSDDAELIALGHQFDDVAAQIDHAIDGKSDLKVDALNKLRILDTKITSAQAKTVDGLRVKARAACWALLGDLDAEGQSSTNERMSLSIVRDLIRLHDAQLEHPGALKQLVADLGR